MNDESVIVKSELPTEWAFDEYGNIHFLLTSSGLSPEQWKRHLEARGLRIGDRACAVLFGAHEMPTFGKSYHVVVCFNTKLSPQDRTTADIRNHAKIMRWETPHWEVACLIRDAFTDQQLEEMGLWYVAALHEPINDSEGNPYLLSSRRDDVGHRVSAQHGSPDSPWFGHGGFAFVVLSE